MTYKITIEAEFDESDLKTWGFANIKEMQKESISELSENGLESIAVLIEGNGQIAGNRPISN